jgi:hypothetical protein
MLLLQANAILPMSWEASCSLYHHLVLLQYL